MDMDICGVKVDVFRGLGDSNGSRILPATASFCG
ncbi:Os04g0276032 [Oryza sativa Japonica Group]|uniref:Os04g0276032 protein n=1 Tax=Oryza sativa subsp. japonica TaxID=39947 RepID=C7J1L3_ORYSJ|nr:Os04g0276032 [Oryza sativa Japonica Group]|eukprot:NP_001173828.1 Os04g0276032 [Oryza sativa Japonica Group]